MFIFENTVPVINVLYLNEKLVKLFNQHLYQDRQLVLNSRIYPKKKKEKKSLDMSYGV